MSADVAAIVVTFRQGPELGRCLASLDRELAAVDYEVWIVDNASKDGTPERAESLAPSARILRLPENRGFAAGNNAALSRSTAHAFLLLNPDAELLDGAAAALMAAAVSRPDAGVVAPQIVGEDGRVLRSCWRFPTLWTALCDALLLDALFPGHPLFASYTLGRFDFREPRWVDAATGACLYVPRRTLEAVGLLDEGYFMYSEETDWCRRMRSAGLGVWFEPAARVRHLGQRSSRTTQERLIVESYRSQARYFALHEGRRAAAGLRSLTALAALVRLAGCTVRRLQGRLTGAEFRQRVRAFSRVLREAAAGPRPTPQKPVSVTTRGLLG